MIIYELEADYAHYLEALGAPQRLVRKYAFRNAMLPQITGLALALGAVIAGALVTEIVFSYPGLGYQIYRAITNEDYFVIQGIFLFIIVGVLIANFIVDIVYVIVDPRTRIGHAGRPDVSDRRPHRGTRPRPAQTGRAEPGAPASARRARAMRRARARRSTSRCGTGSSCSALERHAVDAPLRRSSARSSRTTRRSSTAASSRCAPTTKDGYWFGTTLLGQDVYAQFVTGLRLAFIVGALGGGIAAVIGMLVGFTAGYRGGMVDEVLNMLTNVVLVIPTFARAARDRRLPRRCAGS